jgi:tetratricopeptide (TPR) repeat protein
MILQLLKIKNQIQCNKYEDAVLSLTRHLNKYPDDFRYLSLRGICYERIRDFDKALVDLNKAHLLRPQDTSILTILAGVYHDKGDLLKSKETFKKAFALGVKDFNNLRLYGILLLDLKEYQAAVFQLELAKKHASTDLERMQTDLLLDTAKSTIRDDRIRSMALEAFVKALENGSYPRPNVPLDQLKISPFETSDGDSCIIEYTAVDDRMITYFGEMENQNSEWVFKSPEDYFAKE